MSRYIDADKTKKHFGDYFEKVGIVRRYAESIVDNAIPTADVVEVVRRKDCKFNKGYNKCLNEHSIIDIPNDDDYCSYGERKD